MRKTARYILILLCVLVGSGIMPMGAAASDTIVVETEMNYGQSEARTMLQMINEFRTGSEAWYWNSDNVTKTQYTNLEELKYDSGLEKMAMQRAAEIAMSFSHTRPNGEDCFTAYEGEGVTAKGENIAAGYTSAAAAFVGLQEKDEDYSGQGHRRNMLSDKYNAVGVGHVYYNGYHYWVQEFGYVTSDTGSVTEAVDGLEVIPIDILLSNIEAVSVIPKLESITVELGESADLPEVEVKIKVTDGWPASVYKTVNVPYSWSADSTGHVRIVGNSVEGISVGTDELTATALNSTADIQAIVICTHTWRTDITQNATCTTTGIRTYTCTKCGESYTEEIEATGHTMNTGIVTKEASCETVGVKTYTCTKCGWSYTEEIEATGHTMNAGVVTKEATCEAAGVKTYTCTKCGWSYTEEIEATGHTMNTGVVTTKATCEAAGIKTYTCTKCGWSYTEEIEATGHTMNTGIVTKEASCVAEGVKTYTCTKCGWSYTEQIPMVEHNYVTKVTKADVQKDGAIISECTKCGYVKSKTIIYAPSSVNLSKISYTYNGKECKPVVTVKDSAGEKVETGNYTVTYRNNKNVGQATVIITFKGNYSGTVNANFQINPKSVKFIKIKAGSKSFVATWNKASQITGYQIQYSTSKNFTGKNTKSVIVSKSTTVSKTFSKLTGKKKYYVRIRTYKTVKINGKSTKLYSAWSAKKKITTKK